MSEKIQQLQLIQQNLQNVAMQKQQIQNQLLELNSALNELESTDKAYKIVGKIMLSASKEDLVKDLNEKKEVADVRLKNFTKQEETLQKSIDDLQKEVMAELQKDKEVKEDK
ncbi:prefoldin subunit beta [Candidatus Woesearchaeota archaeon]|jgi:prefoldin beta subunit|nr:prefoldin subunit beta [Candidatus Woesearchaeota archaeon]MBT5343175.1 prefoldin subunit beta [Candidatus Woesearchaeota archaeon]